MDFVVAYDCSNFLYECFMTCMRTKIVWKVMSININMVKLGIIFLFNIEMGQKYKTDERVLRKKVNTLVGNMHVIDTLFGR